MAGMLRPLRFRPGSPAATLLQPLRPGAGNDRPVGDAGVSGIRQAMRRTAELGPRQASNRAPRYPSPRSPLCDGAITKPER